MKNKATKKKSKVGLGTARIKSITKELRKQYGSMLKRLADNEEQSAKT